MTKLTEQAVASFLEIKIANLQKKLSKKQSLLAKLQETHDPAAVSLKKKEIKLIKKSQDKVKRVKTKAKKDKPLKTKGDVNELVVAPSLNTQIKHALTAGPAFRQAITDALVANTPGADAKKLGREIENTLREMVKNNELGVEKDGSKYRYSLIPAATA